MRGLILSKTHKNDSGHLDKLRSVKNSALLTQE